MYDWCGSISIFVTDIWQRSWYSERLAMVVVRSTTVQDGGGRADVQILSESREIGLDYKPICCVEEEHK